MNIENLKEVIIVSGARLPVGPPGGSLKGTSVVDMGVMVVREVVKRAGVEPPDADETAVGQVGQIAECGLMAGTVSLKAELPESTCTYSASHQCSSGLQATAGAMMEIQIGFADVVTTAGTENISQFPYYVKDVRWGARMGHKAFEDGVTDILTWPLGPYHNGVTVKNVAERYNITRQEQDQYALESHLKTVAAIEANKFKDKILPVELKDRKRNIAIFDTDEDPRASQAIEKPERLKLCFVKDGTVTAGNSSSSNDGAAAIVVMSREKVNALGVRPLLTIEGYTVADNDGAAMGYAPKFSNEKLMAKLGLDLRAIDTFEINETFASQAFVIRRDLGLDPDKVSIHGGGISIGHPISTTDVILAVKVLHELQQTDKKDAMVSMCTDGGQETSIYFTKN